MMLEIRSLERITRLAQGKLERDTELIVDAGVSGGVHAVQMTIADLLQLRREREFVLSEHGAMRAAQQTAARRVLPPSQALLHSAQQFLQRYRLLQKIHCTDAGGLNSGIDGRMAGHHDHRHREQPVTLPFFQKCDPIGIRHPDIE